jgi:sporadic carbohydrate cluster protein (TIGR04323 family)
MKKIKGYIFSRPFMGERVPQHVQNIVIRDYCSKKKMQYLLSASEYKMKNCYLILEDLASNMRSFNGIAVYSLFQMPENNVIRNKILKKILKKKKSIFFAVEQIEVKNYKDIKKIDTLIKIKKKLPYCKNYEI